MRSCEFSAISASEWEITCVSYQHSEGYIQKMWLKLLLIIYVITNGIGFQPVTKRTVSGNWVPGVVITLVIGDLTQLYPFYQVLIGMFSKTVCTSLFLNVCK